MSKPVVGPGRAPIIKRDSGLAPSWANSSASNIPGVDSRGSERWDSWNDSKTGMFGDSRNDLLGNPYYWVSPQTLFYEPFRALTGRNENRYVSDHVTDAGKAFDVNYDKAFSPEGVASQKAYGEAVLKAKAKADALARAKAPKPTPVPTPPAVKNPTPTPAPAPQPKKEKPKTYRSFA